jgi:quaternary ammonium compound-resistance protein SugE
LPSDKGGTTRAQESIPALRKTDGGPWRKPRAVFRFTHPFEENDMPWIYLLLAGVFEIGFAIGLKYTEGFTRLWPSVGTVVSAAISLWLLTQALRAIPVGTAYAIWTGIGAVGVATLGLLLFSESASPARLLCIALIISGVIGLKLTSA